MSSAFRPLLLATSIMLLTCSMPPEPAAGAEQTDRQTIVFSAEQADRGKSAYRKHCAACHGAKLDGSGMAPSLAGAPFMRKWGGQSADALYANVRRMPPGDPGRLDPSTCTDILAYLLQANGVAAGSRPAPSESSALQALIIPLSAAMSGAATPKIVSFGPSDRPSRLDGLTAVTDAQLREPPAQDWLMWRRTYDGFGFSPLQQIDRSNVKDLRVAWTWSLPQGGNMMAPIIRDGVLFAYSFGDVVEALDATTGELLWRHQRKLQDGAVHQGKKGVAIHGTRLLVPTSDVHMLALDARSGAVLRDHAIDVHGQTTFQIKSAPLVVGDKVIVGLNGFSGAKGGSFIVALDLDSGREVWRFYTIARPGEPGGESWNGLPLDQRSGGSVWVGGSYDRELDLLYFGVAPTYDTIPLRQPARRPGVTNDALYTNSTLALDPDTGKLVWYFQHQVNDQLDHDWAFERQVLDLEINGDLRKVVVTGGKQAIFETMDAANGEYVFSIDLGLQNVIAAIDPQTGAKTLNPEAIPGPNQVLRRISMPGICPDLLGARNLMATSYDPDRRTLYAPLTDTCRQPFPDGERWQKHPAEGYGLVKALNLQTRKVMWTTREHAPPTSATVATAGGLVFVGDADRWFRAYDDRDGRVLWQARLDNVPASYPVTYSVDGRQYVAVATNEGFVHAQAMIRTAKIVQTPNAGATLWVFALPEE